MTNILGVDVSHWQGNLYSWWPKAKAAGVVFGWAKATDGSSYVDPEFARNMAGMQAAGILRGAYHFIEVGSGAAQADHFVSTVKAQNGGRLEGVLCCLDVERGTVGEITEIRAFVNRFRTYTAQPLWIYAASHWRDGIGNPPGKTLGPLWHPRYPGYTYADAVRNLSYYLTMTVGDWPTVSMWQFADNMPIGGITTDANIFPGSLAQLQTFTAASGAVIPTGDDMAQADIDAINGHMDDWFNRVFSSLSHGMLPDGSKRNGTGIDQVVQAIAALSQTVLAEGTSPAELTAALKGLLDPATLATQISDSVIAKLPAGSSVDTTVLKSAVKDGVRELLVTGVGTTL